MESERLPAADSQAGALRAAVHRPALERSETSIDLLLWVCLRFSTFTHGKGREVQAALDAQICQIDDVAFSLHAAAMRHIEEVHPRTVRRSSR